MFAAYWHPDPYRNARIGLQQGHSAPALHLLTATRGDAETRIHALDTLRKDTIPRLPQLEAELEQNPSNQELCLLVGTLQQAAGWRARGSAYMSDTSREQVAGLQHHLGRARESLRRAAELLPGDPAPWYELMGCAMASSKYPGEVHDMWAEVVQRGGDVSYGVNSQRLIILTGKWHGSEAECFAFARERSRDLPPGHPLHALIPLAHIEKYVSLRSSDSVFTRVNAVFRYFGRRDVRKEIDQASDRLLAGTDTYATHTAAPAAHQAFGYVFYDRGEPDRARRHLERGGDEAIWPWTYFGVDEDDDGDAVFDRARLRAGLPPRVRP
jgi:hypothetical protein